jgi:hypothetical protein
MHATIHRFRRWPDEESEEWGHALLTTVLDGDRPVGACVLGRLDGMDGAVVTYWDDEFSAATAAQRTGGDARWLDARVYRVAEMQPGADGDAPPAFAQVVWLNGGGSAERADAAIRAGRERIAPALRDLEGVVGTHVLRADDDSVVVVTLVTGVEVPEALSRAVLATELLAWEDPAQLVDPDRVDVDRVLVADLPALAGAEAAS